MTTVSPKKDHDPTRVNEISEKLMENPGLPPPLTMRSPPRPETGSNAYAPWLSNTST